MRNQPTLSETLRKTIIDSQIPFLILEQKTGVDRNSISRFVRHERTLRLDKADALATYFELSLIHASNERL